MAACKVENKRKAPRPGYVYMLRCEGNRLYTGWTDDPASRLHAHKSGKGGAKFTHAFRPTGFCYLEKLEDKSAALKREAAIKKLPKPKKEALCAAWAETSRPRLSVAAAEDAGAMQQLYNWYVENSMATFQTETDTPEAFARWLADTMAQCPVLLAKDGTGRLLGFACAHSWYARQAFGWDREITIYCAPDACGLGVGDKLYPPLLALLRRQGVWNVYARITDPNPASEAFHARHGFVCEGRSPRTGYKLGHWVGLSTWRLTLRGGFAAPGPVMQLPPDEVETILHQQEK